MSEKRLRAADLDKSIWGVRSTAALDDLAVRAGAYLLRLPQAAFLSHATALAIHGAPLPGRLTSETAIDIAMPVPNRGPHAKGIRGHRLEVLESDIQLVRGLRTAVPGRAWIDAAMQFSAAELVGVGDFLIHRDGPLVAYDELAVRIERHPEHLAGRRLRTAIDRLDDAAESYPESLLRVLLLDAGFSRPEVNVPLRVGGRSVRPDLAYPRHRVIIEYQGDYHREPAQWRADMRRREALESAGWTVIEVNWDDICSPGELFARLRALGVR